MRVTVGYCDNPDAALAGRRAATIALEKAGQTSRCDLVLLFSTSRHDPQLLREAVVSVVGEDVPIYGGAASGAISDDAFGYDGDQVILAAFWLEGVGCEFILQGGLEDDEYQAGLQLGGKLGRKGIKPVSPVMLFYDAFYRVGEDVRLVMATSLLAGLEKGLGYLPNLTGAGLQGDYVSTLTKQWAGRDIVQHHALAMTFSEEVKVDSIIMHGCRPATGYYMVTKADGQTILEINGRPALQFIDELLGHSINPGNYPFFLILGINKGYKWGPFNEDNYASRLCLAIDQERGGIVMFESDMIKGTEFQIMFRSLDYSYMPAKIDRLFDELGDRKPVLATYINCAGRAGAYAGTDAEDARVIQTAVNGRVPLMGLYSGVEIAPVGGQPRGLDWTGVFSLISVPK